MNKKITTNDISNILGISRNTVSKALNNHPGISDKTKKKVIDQAIALGYKKVMLTASTENTDLDEPKKSIAFLTKTNVRREGYWLNVMRGVERIMSGNGHVMNLSFIKSEEVESLVLPQIVNSGIDGFIVAGSLNMAYTQKLIDVPLPKVFIDINSDISFSGLRSDIVLMESEESVYQITRHLFQSGHTEIGYIGGTFPRTFKERWLGFTRAHQEANISLNPDYCLTGVTPSDYQHYEDVARSLGALQHFPTAIVCANDLIALHAIKFFKERGMKIPGDIAVSGFDQIKETEFLDFSLTTVFNDDFQLGVRAAEELMFRMRSPNRPFEAIRLSTQVIIGDSTTGAFGGRTSQKSAP